MTAKEKQGFGLYFLLAFGMAWLLQVYASLLLLRDGNAAAYQLLLAVSMFCPLVSVLLVQKFWLHQPTGISWRPRLKGNGRYLLAAWFGPAVFTVLAAVLYGIIFGATDALVGVFNSESSARMAQFAHMGMRLYFVGYFFAGFNIVAAGYLSATNRPVEASVTSICRGMVAIVACSLVLSRLFGMNGVWAAFPASELLTAVLTLFLLLRGKKQTA
jgi:hypothetical protein